MSMTRNELTKILNQYLRIDEVRDYCPNGLQIEGSETIHHIVTGVTASQALIEKAIDENADAILVHHGYFWKGESSQITGIKQKRIKALLQNDINLLAYHLPLDIHPVVGNNAQLGQIMQLTDIQPLQGIKPEGIVYSGKFESAQSAQQFEAVLAKTLDREVLVEASKKLVNHVAWCTGGGQGYIEEAALAGVDAFVTGEVSEQTIHVAREMNISFFSAGHHATERYGIKALGEWLQNNHPITVNFIDIANPA